MKSCGVLLHISSLPNKHGIGSFGESAYRFVDFLKSAGQKYWQVLPLGVTSYGDSPYQTFSVNAGNPYFIDITELYKEGLIKTDSDYEWSAGKVDYATLYQERYKLLETIDMSKINKAAYTEFCTENAGWLDDYALFMTLKKYHGDRSWCEWQDQYKNRDKTALEIFCKINSRAIELQKAYQFLFYKQWHKLKAYANSRNIEIIGDMPIYVAYDSVDVWRRPELFALDGSLNMTETAGVPPDYFSETGQLWGNPLYNWEYMERDNYAWWIDRIRVSVKLFDHVRIDHFRGFESYYAIPAGHTNAMEGTWKKGPGLKLFDAVNKRLESANIIAEDLGYMTQGVIDMLNGSGYPGMKVLLFAFDGSPDNDHLPDNFKKDDMIVYTGTHDNETIYGWYKDLSKKEREYADKFLKGEPNKSLISMAYKSRANIAIIPMQDFMKLGKEARMNTPSTLGGNWEWRLKEGDLTSGLAAEIKAAAKKAGRATD